MDLEQAFRDAIHKVSPVHSCYSMPFDWDTLHLHTFCWPGEWINKTSVKESMDAWFDFAGDKLVPKRVELRNIAEPDKFKLWP
jgi:hypothetical protein